MLCALPVAIAALPVQGSTLPAAALRARILASARVPYQGYAESSVDLGLPQLPDLGDVSNLLDGVTDQYVWYRSPANWRADEVTGTGENDVYTDGGVTFLWNYGSNLFTQVTGTEPVRLPRAPDLLPPALAHRLLDIAGAADQLSRLPAQRVAGVDAAGLRVVPADQGTTISAIDIWADPATGLPVKVQIFNRSAPAPVLTASFLELSISRPSLDTVIPQPAPGVGFTTTALPNVDRILNGDADGDGDGTPFPATLGGAGKVSIPGSPPGVAAYGRGLAQFVLLPLPRDVGTDAYNAAIQAGADTVVLAGQVAVVIQTPLITVLMVVAGFRHTTFLFSGAVTPAVLENAAVSMVNFRPHFRRGR